MTQEEFERLARKIGAEGMREVLQSEVLYEGRRITLENLMARRMMEAARHPGLSKADRDKAFRFAKDYLAHSTADVPLRFLHVEKSERVKDKETNE